jgi:hypothetical protein
LRFGIASYQFAQGAQVNRERHRIVEQSLFFTLADLLMKGLVMQDPKDAVAAIVAIQNGERAREHP